MSEEKTGDSGPPEYKDEEKQALYNNDTKEVDGAAVPVTENNMDASKVKFVNGKAQDAHIEMGGEKDGEFVGLTKEELMKYANDPYWVRVRWIMLILFWVAWFGMLAAAIIIIVVAPRCPYRPNLSWWQKDVIYQAYPRSFKDSNGDGIGDIKGIAEKLDHVKNNLLANAVWLNPVYKSGGEDMGYDIVDFKSIDPDFGTMEDFEHLRSTMHKKEMKLIMDFVPNHSSKKHPWFDASRLDKSEKNAFRDYYVWADGKNGGPPNNWKCVFGGPAWTLDPNRGQYYLHQLHPEKPDLNLRNPKVQEELEDIMKFWLKKGVDGFRIDAAEHLFEVNDTSRNEVKNPNGTATDTESYSYYDHKLTTYQPETYEILTKWRELVDKVSEDTEKTRFIIVEVYGTPEQVMPFYEYNEKKGADMPFNMNLLNMKEGCNAKCVRDLVHNWMSNMPDDKWPNWVLGNHDESRIATKIGEKFVNAANMLLLLLPGTATTYYGDELGMVDGEIDWEDVQDPWAKEKGQSGFRDITRDPQRTPMQWNTSPYAGFTSGNDPWLPVNEDYKEKNVKVELASGSGMSKMEVFKSFSKLRQEPSFQWGKYKEAVTDDSVFSFVRTADGFDGYLVAINFGPQTAVMDFHASRSDIVPKKGVVVASTANFDSNDFKIGKSMSLDNIVFKESQGLVFKWAHDALDD